MNVIPSGIVMSPVYVYNYMYRDCAFTSFTLSVIESKWKYTKAAAILRGKNVQWVAVGDFLHLSVLIR